MTPGYSTIVPVYAFGSTKKEESDPPPNCLRMGQIPLARDDYLYADNRLDRAPVGVTEHAQSLHLKPVRRGGRQAGNGDPLLNGRCGDCRPRTGRRSIHYRITDEVRL